MMRLRVSLSPYGPCNRPSVTVSQSRSVNVGQSLSFSLSVILSLLVCVSQYVSFCLTLSLKYYFISVDSFWISNAYLEKITIWLQRISAITDKKGRSLDFR